ncbi:MAG: class I SAM-dependent methyltransferase [Thermodesulfovibrionales bacterium]|nr:class I SAM-dependent methyltransferase [Thermodesulfovibrionales bacterium]
MQGNGKERSYGGVTETPDTRGSSEQIARLYTRYRFASGFCEGKDVLEVACGAGIGLGYLARHARRVVGGDIDENNLRYARQTYTGKHNIEICLMDAQSLPFGGGVFDAMILYEAIYYLQDAEKFVSEAHRVIRKGGVLLVCTVNKDWPGFNPSPYSHRYFSSDELFGLLKAGGFSDIALYGDCPATPATLKGKLISGIKRAAVALHLIPKTMKGKELLKRIFFGKLRPLPPEIDDGIAEYTPPRPIDAALPNRDFKVLFAAAKKP